LELAGGAIERAGRQKDILPFYEKIWKDSFFSSDQKEFARTRWIITKEKQADREEEKSGKMGNAQKHRNEALELRREIGALDEKLPKYPVINKKLQDWSPPLEMPLPIKKTPKDDAEDPNDVDPKTNHNVETKPVVTTVEKTEKAETTSLGLEQKDTTILLGDIRLEFSPSRGRVNLTHKNSMDQAAFRISNNIFTSNDVEFSEEEPGCFLCQNWSLICFVDRQKTKTSVVLTLEDVGISLTLNFPKKIEENK